MGNSIPMYERVKLLTKAHKRTEGDIHEFNHIWKVDFRTMSDEDFRSELTYIEHLLKEEYHEFLS